MDGFPSGQRGRTVNPLSTDFEGSNPSPSIPCPSGGTGRRTGLKIPRGNTRTGSIPVSGTQKELLRNQEFFFYFKNIVIVKVKKQAYYGVKVDIFWR